MNILENIKEGIISLFINKVRVILSLLSIICSVGILISVAAVSEGYKRFVIDEVEKMGTNVIEIMTIPLRLNLSNVEEIRSYCGIKDAIPVVLGEFMVQQLDKEIKSVIVEGTLPTIKEIANLSIEEGRFFTEQETNSAANVCVIGAALYKKLFKQKNPIGESIYLVDSVGKKTQLTIVGALKEMGAFRAVLIDNEGIILPITLFRSRLKEVKYLNTILAQVDSLHQIEKVVTQIKKVFELKHHIKLQIGTQDNLIAVTINLYKKVTTIGYSIAIIFLLVGGINIMGIQLKSLTEKIKEIGIRRAVGAKRRDIIIQFLSEAIMVGIIGGLLGVLLGINAPFLVFNVMAIEGSPVLSLAVITTSFSFAIIMSVLFSVYPAYKASQVNPVEGLRYE